MKTHPAIALSIVIVVAGCAPSNRRGEQSQTVTIPLDQIWAVDMPGTHDVRELEPEKFGERTRSLPTDQRFKLLDESMTDQIRVALRRDRPSKGSAAQVGFAVIGTGREALEGAYDVLAKKKRPEDSFPLDSNVTLAFFSHLAGQYVHLKRIERHDTKIEVGYQVVPHMTTNSTWHFALIPVGKLPIGKYEVQINQLPGGKDKTGHFVGGLPASEAQRIVCGLFSFSVVDQKDER